MANNPTEPVSIGEGFAYFRWHALRFAGSHFCRGINDARPGFGIDACAWIWARRKPTPPDVSGDA